MEEIILQGDCLEQMKTLEDNSVDTIITDPPYGLSFMGKKWDYDVPAVEVWSECLRVLKPGGTALIFAGSRTQHRMAVNVEDAGFVLKDTIMYMYGSGFPKSHNISKQIDKLNGRDIKQYEELGKYLKQMRGDKPQNQISKLFPSKTGGLTGCVSNWELGANVPTKTQWIILKKELNLDDSFDELINRVEAEREVIGKNKWDTPVNGFLPDGRDKSERKTLDITKSSTPEAKLWDGRGTALKPAYEPILLCQKPNDGTYAANALKWGVSGLNIDGGRIPGMDTRQKTGGAPENSGWGTKKDAVVAGSEKGRFPANIILDEEAGAMLDEQSGNLDPGGQKFNNKKLTIFGNDAGVRINGVSYKDKGGASRFFYCAKASKAERNAGCEKLQEKTDVDMTGRKEGSAGLLRVREDGSIGENPYAGKSAKATNSHPTVKPLKLMEYLCTLTKTPTGGLVLDPFAGSGTTGVACQNTGRPFILIEREAEYIDIIKARLQSDVKEVYEESKPETVKFKGVFDYA